MTKEGSEASGIILGQSIAHQRESVNGRVPDLSVIDTPGELLRVMLYELGSRAVWATKCGAAALEAAQHADPLEFWNNIDLMLIHGSSASSFLWPGPQRRRELRQAFPRRGEDLRQIMGMDEDGFDTLRSIRNSMVHTDERLEAFALANPGMHMGMRSMHGRSPGSADFFAWDPKTQSVIFSNDEIRVPELLIELCEVHKRSMDAFFWMMDIGDGDDSDAATPWRPRQKTDEP